MTAQELKQAFPKIPKKPDLDFFYQAARQEIIKLNIERGKDKAYIQELEHRLKEQSKMLKKQNNVFSEAMKNGKLGGAAKIMFMVFQKK